MGRFILEPLQENDPVFRRGPVNYLPFSAPESLPSKTPTSTKDGTSTPTPTQEKASKGREGV